MDHKHKIDDGDITTAVPILYIAPQDDVSKVSF